MNVRRFTRAHPCPICGGYDDAARGQGERCYGFLSPDGRWAHCTREEYAGDLPLNTNSSTYPHKLVGNCRCGQHHDPRPDTPREHNSRGPRSHVVATYDYCDESGTLLYQVVRMEPKTFRQRRPNGKNGWLWSLDGVRRVLYRLPELLTADPSATVYVTEGEKDVDRLVSLGLAATTNAQGAGKWRSEYAEALKGRHVVILPDNDNAGRQHADQVAATLQGVAASVRVLYLPNLPDKGDVSDWFNAGGAREELERLASEAPDTQPLPSEEDARPWIDTGQEDLPVITAEAWTALQKANDPPFLFSHAGTAVRLETNCHDTPILRELNADRMRYELARAARWYVERQSKGDDEPVRKLVHPPQPVVHNVLATPNSLLPELTRIVAVPVFALDGQLQTARGYHSASQTYYAPSEGFDLPDVPETPSTDDVARARELLLGELVVDFPFVGESDRAHAVALFLLPFVRDLIDGPTPLHLIEAPSPGSGKGLLVDVLLHPSLGRHISIITDARDDDEWRKRLTAVLQEGHAAVLIDNLTRPLDSGVLAAALTALTWADRILGKNETVQVTVRCAWVATANNPMTSTEIARRCIRVRLDPKVDRPWQREGFKHENLREWATSHRAELVWAALTMVRAWLAAGMPRPKLKPLGSYESWSQVVSGILATAEIPGFLANLTEFYDAADVEGAAWRAFVAGWWEKHGDKEMTSTDLLPLAQATEGLDLGKGNEHAQKVAFGRKLARQRDRVIGDYRVIVSGKSHRTNQWRLIPVSVVSIGEYFHTPLHAHAHEDSTKILTDTQILTDTHHTHHTHRLPPNTPTDATSNDAEVF